jgi:hypothetical protein
MDGMDEADLAELREAVVNADSLLSLVAYRYPKHIPADVIVDMKHTANKLRDFYDTGRYGAPPPRL